MSVEDSQSQSKDAKTEEVSSIQRKKRLKAEKMISMLDEKTHKLKRWSWYWKEH